MTFTTCELRWQWSQICWGGTSGSCVCFLCHWQVLQPEYSLHARKLHQLHHQAVALRCEFCFERSGDLWVLFTTGGVCCVCRQVTTSAKQKKNMLESVFGLPQAVELVPEIVVFCLNGKTGLEKVQSLYLAALEVKAFQPSAESAVVGPILQLTCGSPSQKTMHSTNMS